MILMYHKVDLTSPTMWWVDVMNFYRHMCSLSGKDIVYLDDYDSENERHVVITFDGVYSNILKYAAPIMKRFGYPFELFITSEYIGLENEFDRVEPAARFAGIDELSELISMGGRLQWHTRSHCSLKISRDNPDWALIEHELSIPDEIKQLDPMGFSWFAYPYGDFSSDVIEEVAKKFKGALSCNQGNRFDVFTLNRITALNSPLPNTKSVCVIVVSYNYGMYLAEAVESVLRQTMLPDSIIIVDDASTDNSREIGEKYASLYPGLITFLRNDKNLGIVKTFNKAVFTSTSDYICILGADNRLSSNYLEAAYTSILSTGSDVAYTDFRLFGEFAHEEYLRHALDRQGRIIEDQYYEIVFPEFSTSAMLQGNFIHGSSLYSRAAFNAVGGYKDRMPGKPEDANLFKRMIASRFRATKVEDTWLEYRQHSLSQANIISRLEGEVEFLRFYSSRLSLKVKTLEVSFGLLSPLVKMLSAIEVQLFRISMKVARTWRRLNR